jgi:glucuronate isomerase
MASFIHSGFLFTSRTGERLYHDYSENLPVIDFHCHLSPEMISADRQFENLSQAWLEGDHYKWRAMRINGIDERFCTGSASPEEKFMKWAETVPYTLGNPLYHWTHLELARYFGIFKLLSPKTARRIYDETSSMLRKKVYSTRSLLRKMKVELLCTTDDPADDLAFHRNLKATFDIPVLPTFRPDNIIKTDEPGKFTEYIRRLSEVSCTEIRNFGMLIEALDKRHEYFHINGCRLSDHGLDNLYYTPAGSNEVDKSFQKLLNGKQLSIEETSGFRTIILGEICRMNHRRGWVQQFHLGAMRNNNSRMFSQMGPDTGWDSIGGQLDPSRISRFLSSLDEDGKLAKTIIYNINPSDNEMMITMAGNFNDGTVPGRIQYGAAWWFLDQKNGLEKHLRDISSLGLLSRFAGMVTDSRSFLSYPRHEYFRRIACNYIGEEVDKGLMPADEELLRNLVEGICYKNAKEYFRFNQ